MDCSAKTQLGAAFFTNFSPKLPKLQLDPKINQELNQQPNVELGRQTCYKPKMVVTQTDGHMDGVTDIVHP